MTYDEAHRRRQRLESEYRAEMRLGQTQRLLDLNKQLTQAIFDEAHADREPRGASPQ
jgi:hypothetical protein